MNQKEKNLTKKQSQAIIELLDPSNKTVTDVARKMKLNRVTLWRWMEQPEFSSQLELSRNKLRDQSFNKLKTTLTKAVDVLGELLDSPQETIRLRASQAILDCNFKIAEYQEIEERLSKIEEVLKNGGHKTH